MAPSDGRPTDEDLTARILIAGAEALRRDGYAALRVEQLARTVGCGKTAIYRRYPDKPSLVAAIVCAQLEVGECPDTGSVREDLLEHLQQNQRNHEHGLGSPRARHAMFEPEVLPLVWDAFVRHRREHGRTIIARGIARAELPDTVDADALLDALAGFTFYRHTINARAIEMSHLTELVDALLARPPHRHDVPKGQSA